MKGSFKIANKARFSMFLISVLITIIIIGNLLFFKNQVFGSRYEYDYEEIKIVEGDTLWTLALDYVSDEYDVRRMIYEIREFNKMDTSDIYEGEVIRVPIIDS